MASTSTTIPRPRDPRAEPAHLQPPVPCPASPAAFAPPRPGDPARPIGVEIWRRYRDASRGGAERGAETLALRNELTAHHYPVVRAIARRLAASLPRSIDVDDLVGAGVLGLLDAIRAFDPERGSRFEAFCQTRVRGAMLDDLRSQDWVPRPVRERARRIERKEALLRARWRREPTHAELAGSFGMDVFEFSKELERARAAEVCSLGAEQESSSPSLGEGLLADERAREPGSELEGRERVRELLNSLDGRQRLVVELYYLQGRTMGEIGELLSVTESRVCQLHAKVMARFRAAGREEHRLAG